MIRSAGGWSAVKDADREGIRIASNERLLGSSEFVESALKQAGEAYGRRMHLLSAGLGLPEVVGAVCHHLAVEDKELSRPGRRTAVVQARRLIGYLATRQLLIPGSEVARRFNQDRSAVSRAARRMDQDAESMRTAAKILEQLIR